MGSDTTNVESLLERMATGDQSARREFVQRSEDRIRGLARGILDARFRKLRNETSSASVTDRFAYEFLRLPDVKAKTVKEFLSLTAFYIEKRLINLAKQFDRRSRLMVELRDGDNGASPLDDMPCGEPDPQVLAEGRELLERVQRLNGEVREVVLLCGYHGFSQAETARQLGLQPKQVSRYMQEARETLNGDAPHVRKP